MRGILQNRWFILAAVVVAVGAFLGATGATLSVVENDRDENVAGVNGRIRLHGGIGNQGSDYITAGESRFTSEAIVAHGHLEASDSRGNRVCAYEYRTFINGEHHAAYSSQRFHIDPREQYFSRSQAIGLSPFTFKIMGPLTGSLRVELWAQINRDFRGTGFEQCDDDAFTRMGSDGARLLNGAGKVRLLPGQSDLFQNGEEVKFDVQSGHGDWSLTVFDGRGTPRCGWQRTTLGFVEHDSSDHTGRGAPPTPSTGAGSCSKRVHWSGVRSTTLTYQVPADAFVENGMNVWRVELWNERIQHGTQEIFVIDQKARAPEIPTVTPDKTLPSVGDRVTLHLTSRVNGQTQKPIASFTVDVWHGDTPQRPIQESPAWVARNAVVTATKNADGVYVGSYTFTVREAARLQVDAYATDTLGRPSGRTLNAIDAAQLARDGKIDNPNTASATQITVKDEKPGAGPTAPPAPDSSILLLVLLVVAVGSVLLWFLPIAPHFRLGLMALAAVGAVAYVMTSGVA